MPVPVQANRQEYTAVSGQTLFPYPFPLTHADEMRVIKNASELILGTHYSVTGVGSESGGNVILTAGAAAGDEIILLGELPIDQQTDYIESDPFPAEATEAALDKLTRICQQLHEITDRCLQLNVALSHGVSGLELPYPTEDPVGSWGFVWNEARTQLELMDFVSEIGLVSSTILNSTLAGLPAAGSPGRLRRLTDNWRGLMLDTGVQWVSLNHRELDVMEFGAIGDGSHLLSERFATLEAAQAVYPHATSLSDEIDWAAMQACANVSAQAQKIYWPRPTSHYCINRPVEFGAFAFNASDQVTGFSSNTNLLLEGQLGTDFGTGHVSIKWTGAEQEGTDIVTRGTVPNTYDYIQDEQAMFHFVGGRFFRLLNFDFDGTLQAWAPVHLEGHIIGFKAEHCTFRNCKVGFRAGTRWSHGFAQIYYGFGGDPSFALGATMIVNGGWQCDTLIFENCFFFANEIANWSSESAQIVFVKFIHSNLGGGNGTIYQVYNVGGRMAFDSCYFTGTMSAITNTYTIFQATGSSTFEFRNCHEEANNIDTFLKTASIAISEQIVIDNCTFPTPNILLDSGGAKLSIRNSVIGSIVRADRDAELWLDIKNSRLPPITINATTVKGNIFVDIGNVQVIGGGQLFQGAGKDDIIGELRNVDPPASLDVFTGNTGLASVYSFGPNNGGKAWQRDGAWCDGRAVHFSGIKDSIPDETATPFVAFATPFELSAMVTVHVMLTTGTGSSRFATSDTVSFSYVRDDAGNVVLSSVVVTGATEALDGFASVARTYTLAHNGVDGRVELSLAQNNEAADIAVSACYEGTLLSALAPGSFQTRPELVITL